MSDQIPKSRILFIEDNEYIGYMYQRALNEAGFETALTSDVKEGLEIAAEEKINPSYVSRVLRLTLLAPEIVDHENPAIGLHLIRRFVKFIPVVINQIEAF